jgi:hypothetical protein
VCVCACVCVWTYGQKTKNKKLNLRPKGRLHEEIARTRAMTSKPFGVNLTILGEKRGEPEFPHEFASVICDNNIKVVETCGGGVPLMTKLHQLLRAGGECGTPCCGRPVANCVFKHGGCSLKVPRVPRSKCVDV